jgi:hypothetical protein
MISLILPYWDRQQAADAALRRISELYQGLDLEVVVVDDGNAVPFVVPEGLSVPVNLVRRPLKDSPSSCIAAWNDGVAAAAGDVIVLSCIEVLHEKPVLDEMLRELRAIGAGGYVLAAAWCPELDEWHCHSRKRSKGAYPIPDGTGRSFCGMMHKELFWRAGGFDLDYAAGAGYEDVDFIYRMLKAGAEFRVRDDLVVIHPKTGASISWPAEMFARNLALLEEKWPNGPERPITFCCLQAGNYCERGAEYVNKLFDMVARSLPGGTSFRFVCLTDDRTGLDHRIEVMALPEDLERWYGKLYLFKRGVFHDGSRVVYFDLDTVIIGGLDNLLSYRGRFATLVDFFFPERVGPAVMAWEAGAVSEVWERWVEAGMPRNELGDLWWLNQLGDGEFARQADKLQELFPSMFCSFKRDCHPNPPDGAKVVCFHGLPRPHEVDVEWVVMAWKIGGSIPANLQVVSNTLPEQVALNIAAACALDHPWLPLVDGHAGEIAVVGGGPSIERKLDELRLRVASGVKVIATNGAHAYLVEKGIVPDYHMIIDARPENARFITGQAAHYLLASQCAPEIYAAANGPVTVVHMNTQGVLDSIPENEKPVNLISSGSTVGLAAIAVAFCLGYRKIAVYGMDSSYEADHHAYRQSENDQDREIEAVAGGRKFKTTPWMVAQVQAFQKLAHELAQADCEIDVRSYGLLGHVAWLMTREAA